MELSPEELQIQGSSMATTLHRMLADALARVAALEGDKAILELRVQNLTKQLVDAQKVSESASKE